MGFFDKFKLSKSRKDVISGEELVSMLDKLCSLREHALVSTNFSTVRADFLGIEGNEIMTASTLSRDEAIYLLKNTDLTLKFNYIFKSYEGVTRLTGLTLYNDIPAMKFMIPEEVHEQESRYAIRVDNVGNVPVTFATAHNDILSARVLDISVTGVAIVPREKVDMDEYVSAGDIVNLDFGLRDVRIKGKSEVAHIGRNKIGCRFLDLTDEVREKLKIFVDERIQAKIESMEKQFEIKIGRGKSKDRKKAEEKRQTVSSIVVVSRDSALFEKVNNSLKRKFSVYSTDPVLENVKSSIALNPHIILLHIEDATIDAMTLAKRISHVIRSFVPFILMGSNIPEEKQSEMITATGAITYIDIENYNSLSFYKTVLNTYTSIYS